MSNQTNTTYEGELRPRLQLSGQVDSHVMYKDPRVDDILSKIPEEASADNQLADKEYVDEGYDDIRNELIDHVEDEVVHITSQERTTWNAKQAAITDLQTIREGAALGATSLQENDEISKLSNDENYQTDDDVSSSIAQHNEDEEAHQDIRDEIPDIADNVTTTNPQVALSANQGKLLNDRINNLSTRGRFLSLWNCVTGMPLTNPSGYPYQYHTGDFFIVHITGETNYVPSGSTYEGVPSTTVYTGDIKVNDTLFYDGTSWMVFDTPAGSGDVVDVYQNGSSVLSDGIAYVTTPQNLSDLTADSMHRLVTDTEKSTWNAKQNALVSGTNIKTINNQSILGSGNLAVSGLPTITSADDGAFLRAVNGVASWVVLPEYEGGSY